MSVLARQVVSPQARGRELARQGKALWQELGSVTLAARALMDLHRDIPSIQAHRYAASLSQDQAAVRYNEITEHQTTLGGTSINAWETWARGRGAGSPPPFSSLLILARAYGRGPLGVADEDISPLDLVAEAYERLPVEDQLSLKAYIDSRRPEPDSAKPSSGVHLAQTPARVEPTNRGMTGPDFSLKVPTLAYGNPTVLAFTLPNPYPGQLLNLDWHTFGLGIERLIRQIKNVGQRLDVDACFGINEAGLVMATFMASAEFSRCPIGYLKCNKTRDEIDLDEASNYPAVRDAPTIVICDFEVKHADVVGFIARELRTRYPGAELYFAVFGAMTKGADLQVDDFDQLTGARIMRAADFAAIFIAATMSPPGIEPPLELR